jgi:hypothetical protein
MISATRLQLLRFRTARQLERWANNCRKQAQQTAGCGSGRTYGQAHQVA